MPSPNVGASLIRIHKVITRALAVSIENSQDGGPELARRDGFQRYVRAFLTSLISHHDGEEEVAFPYLKDKVKDGPFDLLIVQHRQMMEMLVAVKDWLEMGDFAWDPAAMAKLHAALEDVNSLWKVHIPIEETTFGPQQAAELLTPAENAQLEGLISGHSAQHALPSELVLPFVLYNLSGADREAMAQVLPPVVTQLLHTAWKPAWEPMQPYLLD